MGNYRPISIFSTFSKILEKLIYNRTQSFLEKHSITLPTQYGFRPAYSTSHAMIDILTSTLDNINVQRWSPRGRPWPRGHILKSLALASKPQVLGLGLEASSPQKLPCPQLEDSNIF